MKKIYSIWDSKAEEFAPPFVAKNDAMASRMFLQSIKNIPYADDMVLYCLGNYNSESQFSPIDSGNVVVVPIEVRSE